MWSSIGISIRCRQCLADDPRRPEIGRKLWLQTSPEFGMKRLLAAGAKAIYQITRAFRDGETGPLHNPEFTIVEWYRVGDNMPRHELLSDLCQALLGNSAGGNDQLSIGIRETPSASIRTPCTIEQFSAAAKQLAHPVPAGLHDDRDGWLNLLLAECVEPQLGQSRPTILYDYPVGQAAACPKFAPLVKRRSRNASNCIFAASNWPTVITNCWIAAELRRRNTAANAARMADGKPPLPEDSRLLEAMHAGLPECAGVALGFDRVVMLAAGAKSLAEVLAFPIDRA